ncbi:MAG: IS1595 family transposase [Deltaproteobacteria bacterium]|nr:IS1595 family transposase [Deltaproteobacteria bacterium]
MKSMTIREFFKQFPSDDICLDHVMEVRYGKKHVCKNCGKESKFHKLSNRKAYSCQSCGSHVYPCSGTLFENSRTPLQLWFYAIYLFSTSRHGVPAKELERQLGITYKAAWRMAHEIRKHMGSVDGDEPLSGEIEIDETYIGGKKPGKRGRGADGKTVLFGMLQRNGDIMTKVVSDVKRVTLQPIIKDNVEEGSTVHTDELLTYSNLSEHGYDHNTVNHGQGEYARGNVHVNGLEGYWSNFKKSVKGTHIHISKKHLSKYSSEFEYRYNSRSNPSQMFPELISTYPKKPKK